MHVRWILSAAILIGISGAALAIVQEEKGEVKMKFEQVPAAVRDTLAKEAKGAKIENVDKETQKGKTIYEANVKLDVKNWEIKVDADGKLINKNEDNEDEEKEAKKEEQVTMDQLPAAVKATLEKESVGGKVA